LKNPKRKRQYEHIKESALARGSSESRAEQLAARTVNKQRSKSGETKTKAKPRRSAAGKTARKKSTGTRSRSTSSSRGKSTASRGKSTSSRSRSSTSRSKR
jgi:hypothetical protein